ncbi:MAG: Holliday junction branch migration protein RuvA [Dissulfurimicrobium sp.]|uniref:Holliday junction branch migration protein RuvA n=1 Tax=Dissulfurimicrobium sp. TaxID=2022436 RepID=UPI00404973A0
MIGYLKGRVERLLDKRGIILDVNGVGYEIQMPEPAVLRLAPLGKEKEIVVFTHLAWKEDMVSLYGFERIEERDMFRMLIEVSGVGPRMALNILSIFTVQELLRTIANDDTKRLQSIYGVGKKTAARLCIDLKEKAKALIEYHEMTAQRGIVHGEAQFYEEDVMTALLNLGYSRQEAGYALKKTYAEIGEIGEDVDIGRLLKTALRFLAKGAHAS